MAKTRIEALREACHDVLGQVRLLLRVNSSEGEYFEVDVQAYTNAFGMFQTCADVCGEKDLLADIKRLMDYYLDSSESLSDRRDYRRRLERSTPDQVEHVAGVGHSASDDMDPEVWKEFTGQLDVCCKDYGKWREYELERVGEEILLKSNGMPVT